VSSRAMRLVAVLGGVVIVALAAALYVNKFLYSPSRVAATRIAPNRVQMTLGTTPAVGDLGGNPTWVSFLAREEGQWKHTTVYELPAHSLVDVTIYQFDGDSGLRNPFLSQVQGTVGGVMRVDGVSRKAIPPADASHTFVVPQLGLFVPLPGVSAKAKNQCPQMPCSLDQAHRKIEFAFRTGEPGEYRWQCFVPCAAGFVDGNGGPMQTLGYMDGFLEVE
jgi:hypothetical protein